MAIGQYTGEIHKVLKVGGSRNTLKGFTIYGEILPVLKVGEILQDMAIETIHRVDSQLNGK